MEQTSVKLEHWIALYLCQGVGIKTLSVLAENLSLDSLFKLSKTDLLALGLNTKQATHLKCTDWQRVKQIKHTLDEQSICAISFFDNEYPQQLKHIASAPLLLFCKGDIRLLSTPQIAIVGSRNATPIGLEIASEFAYQLTLSGITVTSGMARGIDGAAHKGALAGSKKTIAVLGTGVDILYPKAHRLLTKQVLESGLLVSEFLPGTAATAHNFPRRNRIISGLTLGVLIVEAEIKSGSLITVRYALEQNKDVFAVPGSIKNPLSQASHFLIKQGAKLVENVSDILDEVSLSFDYDFDSTEEPMPTEAQCKVLTCIGFEVSSVDDIVRRSGLPVEEVLSRLLDLELTDKVERVLDGYIRLG
ncbi:DNA-processing protein DprA [Pseudoalteromonas sp. MMG010]|uniref:DNA-processing protein DprA n=1 Tax=Pseudoalteromonas sp. MMG010 TaxID=2822685 RepID=UPI001B39F9A4|nr:DNA-processing protein DprA [Pseudoalteromonas sp. MMG010]MBQ4834591.1 DNA-processing protein DprA [Pseudoalteromonas sp. MMG010]